MVRSESAYPELCLQEISQIRNYSNPDKLLNERSRLASRYSHTNEISFTNCKNKGNYFYKISHQIFIMTYNR